MGFSKECCNELPFPSLGDLPRPRNWTHVSCIGMWILYHWATREAHPNRQWAKSQSVFPCFTLWTHRTQLRRGRRPESGEKILSLDPHFKYSLIIAINVLRPDVDIKSSFSLNFISLSLLLITHIRTRTHTHTHTCTRTHSCTHTHTHTQLSNLPCRDFSLLGKLNYAWKVIFPSSDNSVQERPGKSWKLSCGASLERKIGFWLYRSDNEHGIHIILARFAYTN